jgi:hypothetical protein
MQNREHIAHMHLHDAIGSSDHQVLFEGELNIKKLLNFAQSMSIMTLIEVKTEEALIKSVDNLSKNYLL